VKTAISLINALFGEGKAHTYVVARYRQLSCKSWTRLLDSIGKVLRFVKLQDNF